MATGYQREPRALTAGSPMDVLLSHVRLLPLLASAVLTQHPHPTLTPALHVDTLAFLSPPLDHHSVTVSLAVHLWPLHARVLDFSCPRIPKRTLRPPGSALSSRATNGFARRTRGRPLCRPVRLPCCSCICCGPLICLQVRWRRRAVQPCGHNRRGQACVRRSARAHHCQERGCCARVSA